MANPATPLSDLTKIIEQFKLPGVDISALVEARRKDIEALTQVNRITFEGVQAMAQKQAEILQKTMEELQAVTQKMAAAPMQNAAKQGELVQQALTRAFGYMHELAEVTRKSQSEAIDVINKRAQQNVEELKSMLKSA